MKYMRRKRPLPRKPYRKNDRKSDVQKRPSKPSNIEPKEDASGLSVDAALNFNELPCKDPSPYLWLSNKLEKLWRTNITFLATQPYTIVNPQAVYVTVSTYTILRHRLEYEELHTAIYNKTTTIASMEMQIDLLATSKRDAAIALPPQKYSEDSTLVVVEHTETDVNPSLETLNSWLDALTKDNALDFSRHNSWLRDDHLVPQLERSKLSRLFELLLQLEAKIVMISKSDGGCFEQFKDAYRSDAVVVSPSAIDRDVLDTIMIRHPVLSQALQGLSNAYKRGRFAVVARPQ